MRTAVATEAGRRSRSRYPSDGRFLGIAVAPSIKREARTAELGYVIHPGARGRGIATAALSWLTDWGFRELDAMHRLELVISTQNPASKRVAEHNGYRYEGTLRSLFVVPGRWEDAEMWSRLATRPTTGRRRMKEWDQRPPAVASTFTSDGGVMTVADTPARRGTRSV